MGALSLRVLAALLRERKRSLNSEHRASPPRTRAIDSGERRLFAGRDLLDRSIRSTDRERREIPGTITARMGYDEGLAERIRAVLSDAKRAHREKNMFGGIAWLFDGAMGVGIAKNKLMIRVGPDAYEAALAEPHVSTMDFTGKPLRGYVYVEDEGVNSDRELARWVLRGADFASKIAEETLAPSARPPAKKTAKKTAKKSAKKTAKKSPK